MYVSSSINNNFALFTCRANKNQSVCPITIRDFRSGGFFCPIHHSSLISVPLPTRPTINTHTTRNDGCYFLHLRRHGSARAHVRASLGYVRGRVLESAPMTGASQTHHIVRAATSPAKSPPRANFHPWKACSRLHDSWRMRSRGFFDTPRCAGCV